MAATQITTRQLGSASVNRDDLDTTTTTKAVTAKVVAGTNISLSSTGVDAGTGDVTVNLSGVVAIANGGIGAATATEGTVFGNPTGSVAAPTFTSSPVLGLSGSSTGILGLATAAGGGVFIRPTAASAASYNFILPTSSGVSGYLLTSGGASSMTWTDPSTLGGGGLTIGTTAITSGTNKRVLFDNSGVLGEDAGLVFDASTDTLSTGVLTIGTLGYTPSNRLISAQSTVNAYNQLIIQNSSNGAAGSSDVVVNNDQSTDTTFYGDFGMNSSGFTGAGVLNQPNYVYLTSTSSDLVIGTTTANSIHFVVNNGTSDAIKIDSAGVTTITNLVGGWQYLVATGGYV